MFYAFKMSSNIYEEPKEMMNMKYSKGAQVDGQDRVERQVEIYESADTLTERRVNFPTQDGRANVHRPPAVQRNPFKTAAVILGLLCLFLAIGIIVLSILYISIKNSNSNLEDHITQLQTEVNELRRNINETLCPEGWQRFRCSCYYKSTEMKSWDDSRADCKNRTAELVVLQNRDEQEFLKELNKGGESWIGLQSVKTNDWPEEWEWRWVDRSTPSYTDFAKDQPVTLKKQSTVSINQQGNWITSKGSKHWICEKDLS